MKELMEDAATKSHISEADSLDISMDMSVDVSMSNSAYQQRDFSDGDETEEEEPIRKKK